MNAKDIGDVIEKRIEHCKSTLLVKSEEYATDNDKLHNFKVAAELQGVNILTALAGMMAKHTVSVYDLIKKRKRTVCRLRKSGMKNLATILITYYCSMRR